MSFNRQMYTAFLISLVEKCIVWLWTKDSREDWRYIDTADAFGHYTSQRSHYIRPKLLQCHQNKKYFSLSAFPPFPVLPENDPMGRHPHPSLAVLTPLFLYYMSQSPHCFIHLTFLSSATNMSIHLLISTLSLYNLVTNTNVSTWTLKFQHILALVKQLLTMCRQWEHHGALYCRCNSQHRVKTMKNIRVQSTVRVTANIELKSCRTSGCIVLYV
jgi:hypothetical protein